MYYVSVMIEVPPTLAVCTIIKFGQDDFVAPGMDFFFMAKLFGSGYNQLQNTNFSVWGIHSQKHVVRSSFQTKQYQSCHYRPQPVPGLKFF